jgi:transposase-like protein
VATVGDVPRKPPTEHFPAILADVKPAKASVLEERSRDFLTKLRWPTGPECPRCGEARRLLWLESRSKWHCYGCRYQFSVTAGTLFHNSHLPLWKWFVAVHLLVEGPEGMSASELGRILPCSYKTAWFAAHRIRAAMGSARQRRTRPADARRHRFVSPYFHSSLRYRPAYLDEERWRRSNRDNRQVFRDTLVALLQADELPYRELVGAA